MCSCRYRRALRFNRNLGTRPQDVTQVFRRVAPTPQIRLNCVARVGDAPFLMQTGRQPQLLNNLAVVSHSASYFPAQNSFSGSVGRSLRSQLGHKSCATSGAFPSHNRREWSFFAPIGILCRKVVSLTADCGAELTLNILRVARLGRATPIMGKTECGYLGGDRSLSNHGEACNPQIRWVSDCL